MTEQTSHGRYARMFAFWALVLLVAYGCFHGGGLADVLAKQLGDSNSTFVDPFPLLKTLSTATLIALVVVALFAFVVYRWLGRPKVAALLSDAEGELAKVTWPTWPEAWQGTMAVSIMVVVLFLFLTVVDLALAQIMTMFMGAA